jgi:plasmid stabilization system protein ParE
MPYALKKLPQAEAEADATAAWYERQKPGLGFEFTNKLDAAVRLIAANPFRCGLRFGDVRRAPIRRFRFYGIYDFVTADEIVIISVFNDRQDPRRLRARREQAG